MKTTIFKRIKTTSTLLLAVLVFFMQSFTKTTATNTLEKTTIVNAISTTIVINKSTTDKEIIKIINSLSKKDIIASFKNIERNSNNEIIAMDIAITKNGKTVKYSAQKGIVINKITITIGTTVSIKEEGFISDTTIAQLFNYLQNGQIFNKLDALLSSDDLEDFMQSSQIFKDLTKTLQSSEVQSLLQKQSELLQDLGNGKNINTKQLQSLMQEQQAMLQKLDINSLQKSEEELSGFFSQILQGFVAGFAEDTNDVGLNNNQAYDYKEKVVATYIVNGKRMTKEQYQKMDKSKVKTLKIKEEVVKTYKKKK